MAVDVKDAMKKEKKGEVYSVAEAINQPDENPKVTGFKTKKK